MFLLFCFPFDDFWVQDLKMFTGENGSYGSFYGWRDWGCYLPYTWKHCVEPVARNEDENTHYLNPNSSLSEQLEQIASTSLSKKIVPLTYEECSILRQSHEADARTIRWLKASIPIGIALTSVSSTAASIEAYNSWYEGETGRAVFATTFALVSASVGSFISYISTGSNPNFSSCAANEKQDCILTISDRYKTLAAHLWKLHKFSESDDLSSKIAESIVSGNLQAALGQLHLSKHNISFIVEPLDSVSRTILGHRSIPHHLSFVSYQILGKDAPLVEIETADRAGLSATRLPLHNGAGSSECVITLPATAAQERVDLV